MVRIERGNLVGVILAGGASRRMGEDKATVEIAGERMIDHVARALGAICPRLVVAGRSRPPKGIDAIAVPDLHDDRLGPLAGLAAVMAVSPAGARLVTLAVDQPWVRPETLEALVAVNTPLPVVPVPDGIRQTTCAVYPADLATSAADELEAGGSIQSLLDRSSFHPFTDADIERVGEDGRSWFSANTPESLDQGLRTFGAPGG